MACTTGKIVYATRRDVMAYVRRSNNGAGTKGNAPYRCSECGYWHLGRKLTRQQQRERRRYMDGRFDDERGLE